jgi:hypothetical protein
VRNPATSRPRWRLRKPELRDPRAFIIPSSQRDFPTAVKFVNALREVNITVHRATAEFEAGRQAIPAWLVRRLSRTRRSGRT